MTALPGSPTDGDIYIVPTGETNGDDVAIRDNGAWVYLTPNDGWRAWVADTDSFVYWDGGRWTAEASGGGGDTEIAINAQTGTTYTFVIGDSKKLVTADNAGAQTYTIPDNATTAFPVGTMISLKGIGAGAVSFIVDGTDTLNGVAGGGGDISAQWNTVTFTKITTTGWTVDGPNDGDRVMLRTSSCNSLASSAGATPGEYANLLVYPLTYDIQDQNGSNSLTPSYPDNPQLTPEGWLGGGGYLKLANTTLPAWLTSASAKVSMYCRLRVDGKNRNGSRDLVVGLGPNSPFYAKIELGVTHEADMDVGFSQFQVYDSPTTFTLPLCSALWNFGFSWPNEYFLDAGNRIRPQGIHFLDGDTLLMSGHYEDTASRIVKIDLPTKAVTGTIRFAAPNTHLAAMCETGLGRYDLGDVQRHAEHLRDRPGRQLRGGNPRLPDDLRHERDDLDLGHRDRHNRRHRVPSGHGIHRGRDRLALRRAVHRGHGRGSVRARGSLQAVRPSARVPGRRDQPGGRLPLHRA